MLDLINYLPLIVRPPRGPILILDVSTILMPFKNHSVTGVGEPVLSQINSMRSPSTACLSSGGSTIAASATKSNSNKGLNQIVKDLPTSSSGDKSH